MKWSKGEIRGEKFKTEISKLKSVQSKETLLLMDLMKIFPLGRLIDRDT